MKPLPIALVVMVAAGLGAGGVSAQGKSGRSCPQALGGYGALDQQVLLEFNGSTDLGFRVLLGQSATLLEGFVYPGEGEEGMEAVVLDNCPDGDVTGTELEACTVWRGAIRAVDAEGRPEPLPGADQPAAGFLQLEGLSRAIAESEKFATAGLSADGFETLTLLACQE